MAENYKMTSFRDCLDACSLMDIDSKGCVFTWANNKEGEDYVKERLDRVVCIIEWRLMYPEVEAFALPAVGLDHSPIILSCQSNQARRKRIFRFEAFWLENDECREVVLNSWAPPIQHQQGLVGKIHDVQTALFKWRKKKFVNGKKEISKLKHEIVCLTNNTSDSFNKEHFKKIQEEIEELGRQEEMYWGLRFRINWLRWGDPNSKYLHATTIQRRQRNIISMLQNAENAWLVEQN